MDNVTLKTPDLDTKVSTKLSTDTNLTKRQKYGVTEAAPAAKVVRAKIHISQVVFAGRSKEG